MWKRHSIRCQARRLQLGSIKINEKQLFAPYVILYLVFCDCFAILIPPRSMMIILRTFLVTCSIVINFCRVDGVKRVL